MYACTCKLATGFLILFIIPILTAVSCNVILTVKLKTYKPVKAEYFLSFY